jgi:hypothetical protein
MKHQGSFVILFEDLEDILWNKEFYVNVGWFYVEHFIVCRKSFL